MGLVLAVVALTLGNHLVPPLQQFPGVSGFDDAPVELGLIYVKSLQVAGLGHHRPGVLGLKDVEGLQDPLAVPEYAAASGLEPVPAGVILGHEEYLVPLLQQPPGDLNFGDVVELRDPPVVSGDEQLGLGDDEQLGILVPVLGGLTPAALGPLGSASARPLALLHLLPPSTLG